MPHTPGPWFYGRSKGGKRYVYGSDKFPIFTPQCEKDRPKEEREANYVLIAAAPIGFELAQAILDQDADGLDRSEWLLNKAREFMCTVNGLCDRADIYRAKAGGK